MIEQPLCFSKRDRSGWPDFLDNRLYWQVGCFHALGLRFEAYAWSVFLLHIQVQSVPIVIQGLKSCLPSTVDQGSHSRQSSPYSDALQTWLLSPPHSLEDGPPAIIIIDSVRVVVGSVIDHKEASINYWADSDNADCGLDLEPECVPDLVCRTHWGCRDCSDQADGDHQETRAKHRGDAELPMPIQG